MQSSAHNGSSFYPAASNYDAQSDVGSSVNGHGGGLNMPGGYQGYGAPHFSQGYGQPAFTQGYGTPPFGVPSPDGWPGPGHNVQAQVCLPFTPPAYPSRMGDLSAMYEARAPVLFVMPCRGSGLFRRYRVSKHRMQE